MSTRMQSLIRTNQTHEYPTMTVKALLEMLSAKSEDSRIFVKSFGRAGYSSILDIDRVFDSIGQERWIVTLKKANKDWNSLTVKGLREILKYAPNSVYIQIEFDGNPPVWYDIHYVTEDVVGNIIFITQIPPANEQPGQEMQSKPTMSIEHNEHVCERYPNWTVEILLSMLIGASDQAIVKIEDESHERLDIKMLTPDNDEELQLLIVHGKKGEFESWTVKKLREILREMNKDTVIQVQFTEPDSDECGEPIWYDLDYLIEIYNSDTVLLVTRHMPTMA